MWTIELNLDDDFASSCAYHIDEYMNTVRNNLEHASSGEKTQRWVLVGLAYTLEEASDKCKKIREMMCRIHNREIKSLPLAD